MATTKGHIMKFMHFCVITFYLTLSSFSWALKITNLSHRSYEVTFVLGQKSSPLCLLGPQEHITDLEAFGNIIKTEEEALQHCSVKIRLHSPEAFPIIWEKLPREAELLIPAEPQLSSVEILDKKNLYTKYFAHIADFVIFYGGILIAVPLGALVSMEPMAQLGGALGPTLLPGIALKLGGHVSFNALNYVGTGFIGVIGGYAVGAVGGALLLPLAFSLIYKNTAALINSYGQAQEEPCEYKLENLEDSWVYLPKDASPIDVDDWVIISNELS